eukprot:GHRQ01034205.1.p1 GENE.GHRQ01034205.1~~GHRQ01034205.1.p1  ORF type:complete len:122 (-),score=39.90 GHRQ01034205.1:76-441(-)
MMHTLPSLLLEFCSDHSALERGNLLRLLKGWCFGCCCCLRLQLNVRQLAELTRLVRGDLSSLGRRLLAALITIDVHSRDIVGSLLAKATSNVNDFEWQMQLRYYFEEEDLVVRQVSVQARL